MLDEWVWLAWNLKGAMGPGEYLALSARDQRAIRASLGRQIEKHNEQFED